MKNVLKDWPTGNATTQLPDFVQILLWNVRTNLYNIVKGFRDEWKFEHD